MEQSRDIRWRRAKAAGLAALMAASLSGCSSDIVRRAVSGIRPEVNNQDTMVLDPVVIAEASGYLTDDDGSKGNPTQDVGLDNDGTNNAFSSDSTVNGTVSFNPDYYAELPYRAMAASDYTGYLDTEVYEPILEIINALPDDKIDRIYFRICHNGYEPYGDNLVSIQQASSFNRRMIGSVSNVGGRTLSEFALNWLLTLDVSSKGKTNRQILSSIRTSTANKIVNSGVSTSSTWQSASTDTRLPAAIRAMWGAQSDSVRAKLSSYMNLLYSETVGVIPNVVMNMRANEEQFITVTINPVKSDSALPYQCRMNLVDVDRLFGQFNQYPNRDSTNIFKFNDSDDGSIVFSYIDGYSKTIVLLGVASGDSLADVLGDKLSEVESIISGTLNYTELAALAEFCEDFDTLPVRSRGVN